MNEELIKIKIRKLEKKLEERTTEAQAGYTEEFNRLFGFICRHLERIELRLRELEIKVEMNKGLTKRQKIKTIEKFRKLHEITD